MAYKLSISITQNSQSVANNTSNVTVKVNCSWTYGTWYGYSSTKYLTINGTKYSFNGTYINPNATTSGSATLFTKTLDIPHNADGTGTVEAYAYTYTTTSSGAQEASASKTLTTIPRKSTVSATNEYIEDNCLITISRKSSKFTHTLKYTFGSLSGTIATKTTATNVNFLLPHSFYAELGSTATKKSGTITCITYNGSSEVGTSTCSFTAYANKQNSYPTFYSAKVTPGADTQALTGNTTSLIRYYSTANVVIGAAARNSATLVSKRVKNSGKTRTTDGAFTEVTSGKFEFYAKDSRGYENTYTETLTLIPYVRLTCSYKAKLKVDGTGTLTISGNYFNGSFGAVANTLTVQYRYKKSGGTYSDWITTTATKSGDTYSVSQELSEFDYKSAYVFQARATDKIATVTPSAKTVKATTVFDWGENDFNHNTDVTIEQGKGLQSFAADGTKKNLIYLTTSDNLMVGGGSYAPKAVYLRAAESGDIRVSNENSDYYSLLGAMKALSTTYEPTTTVTLGDNYSSGSATAYIVGGSVRVGFSATRKSAPSVGNITNETVMTVNIQHDGKLKNLYRVDTNSGIEGGVATFDVQASKIDDNNVKITITLCATTVATASYNCYFAMPCTLNLDAYV